MLFRGIVGGGGGGCGGGAVATAGAMLVRHFSRKRAQDVRRINPKVPREEAKDISESLYQVIKDHGPLTVSNTWIRAQEVGVSGLNSKTHMKIMLKWMWGRKMLKLFCTQLGSAKKFQYTTLPEDPRLAELESSTPTPQPKRAAKKQNKKLSKKKKK